MAAPVLRPELLVSIQQTDHMRRMASDMRKTVIITREIIAASRVLMTEADRLLKWTLDP
jgi:hypothetical protein